MSILEDVKSKLKRMFSGESGDSGSQFLQWKHPNLKEYIVLHVNPII